MPPRKKKPLVGKPPERRETINVKGIVFPVTARDEEQVQCKACGWQKTFREFRLHNMELHYNISTTTNDDTLMDRRFYSRQLSELSKMAKIKTFFCPTVNCDVSYKSALGLAFHLESCGKTKEEKEACFVECDICNEKLPAPNLAWHKRSHMSGVEVIIPDRHIPPELREKRQSAIKARDLLQKVVDEDGNDIEEGSPEKASGNKKDPQWTKPIERIKKATGASDVAVHDITYTASDFLVAKDDTTVWDNPKRNLLDPFDHIETSNPLKATPEEMIVDYLPENKESLEFCIRQKDSSATSQPFMSKMYHRLKVFESDLDEVGCNVVTFTGGSIISMAWHPSGKYLAVSTLKGFKDKADFECKKTTIQIYEHYDVSKENGIYEGQTESSELHTLQLQLILTLDQGVVKHIQWSSYWPKCCDFDAKVENDISSDRLGYLAIACADSACRIFAIHKSYFRMPTNYNTTELQRLRVYTKHPEICLKTNMSLGVTFEECTKFDWHDENKYLVTGYGSGHVALYNLESRSRLLWKINKIDECVNETVFSPIWIIRAHHMSIRGLCFNASDPRYFCSGGADRCIKVYDEHLRMEIQGRKVGLIMDMCWIRGWIHVAIALDAANTKSSSVNNYVRFYNMGTMRGRPNCAQLYSITGVSSRNGLTLQSTEDGKITVTFFDQFWRECDFDRNKKKKNVVDLINTTLDESSFEEYTQENVSPNLLDEEHIEPRIVLDFVKHRLESQQLEEMSYGAVEDFYRFYKYIRINKVCWSPCGNYFAVGYRNGLLVLMPFNFESTYTSK